MEPTAYFDVNLATEIWLQSLRQQQRFRRDDLEELRSHLLDLVDDLEATYSLTSEQAFQMALRQLGDATTLALEFGKVNRWYTWQRKTLAVGRLMVGSKRVAVFSLIFVAITFGSIFGQKPSDKRHKHSPVQASHPKSAAQKSLKKPSAPAKSQPDE